MGFRRHLSRIEEPVLRAESKVNLNRVGIAIVLMKGCVGKACFSVLSLFVPTHSPNLING